MEASAVRLAAARCSPSRNAALIMGPLRHVLLGHEVAHASELSWDGHDPGLCLFAIDVDPAPARSAAWAGTANCLPEDGVRGAAGINSCYALATWHRRGSRHGGRGTFLI